MAIIIMSTAYFVFLRPMLLISSLFSSVFLAHRTHCNRTMWYKALTVHKSSGSWKITYAFSDTYQQHIAGVYCIYHGWTYKLCVGRCHENSLTILNAGMLTMLIKGAPGVYRDLWQGLNNVTVSIKLDLRAISQEVLEKINIKMYLKNNNLKLQPLFWMATELKLYYSGHTQLLFPISNVLAFFVGVWPYWDSLYKKLVTQSIDGFILFYIV